MIFQYINWCKVKNLQGITRSDVVKEVLSESPNLNFEQCDKLLFKRNGSLRLSIKGFRLLKPIYNSYHFHASFMFSSGQLIAIARELEGPYYILPTDIVIFNEAASIVIELSGGIDQFLKKYNTR